MCLYASPVRSNRAGHVRSKVVTVTIQFRKDRQSSQLLGRSDDKFQEVTEISHPLAQGLSVYTFFGSENAEVTDDLFGVLAELTETIRLPRRSARLNCRSMPAERRFPAIRRTILVSALGALGQRIERRALSGTRLLSLANSSVVLPAKPSWANSWRGGNSGDALSARLRPSIWLAR